MGKINACSYDKNVGNSNFLLVVKMTKLFYLQFYILE